MDSIQFKKRKVEDRKILTQQIIEHRHQGYTVSETCDCFNVSKRTYYAYLKKANYNDFGKDHLFTRYVNCDYNTTSGSYEGLKLELIDDDDVYREFNQIINSGFN